MLGVSKTIKKDSITNFPGRKMNEVVEISSKLLYVNSVLIYLVIVIKIMY